MPSCLKQLQSISQFIQWDRSISGSESALLSSKLLCITCTSCLPIAIVCNHLIQLLELFQLLFSLQNMMTPIEGMG